MFDTNARARRLTLGTLFCMAAATLTACAHSQQAPPADSASPRAGGDWQGSRMRHRGQHGDRMLEGLDLTKDQKDRVARIHDRYKLQADSMRVKGATRDSTSRSAFRSMMMQEMSEIRGVLTPDQQKQFDDRMAKMRERHQQNDGRGDRYDHDGHDGPPPDNSGNPPPPPPA
ncbi:MAG: Spy/CpxP family protein refolding chaperone [Gemmatimonadota bacterium]